MDPVQFDPKISADLQVNWRRQNGGPGADLFTDLLADRMKRRAEADRQELDARRRELSKAPRHASDPVSGRPARVAVTHPKTLRGEAKEVDETADRRLPHQPDDDSDEVPQTEGKHATDDRSTAGAKGKGTKAKAKTDAATVAGDQPAQAAGGDQQTPDPAAVPVVVVQPTDQNSTVDTHEVADHAPALPLPATANGQAAVPNPAKTPDAKNAVTAGSPAAAGAPDQPAIETAVASDLSVVLTTLNTGASAASSSLDQPGAAAQPAASPVAPPLPDKQSPLRIVQVPVPIADARPAIQPQAARPVVDTKVRAGNPALAHANADAPDPTPRPENPQQPVQSYTPAPPQSAATFEAGGDGDAFDQPFSADGATSGWALHLAQGAAGKRADFVAQLKQHLQTLPVQEQVAVHIQRALREGTGRVSIQLSPVELGRIHVKLEIDEDKRVKAGVTVERPSTLDLLQRDAKGLERALHDAGLNMEGGDLSFSLGRGGDQGLAQDLRQSGAAGSEGVAADVRPEDGSPDIQDRQVADTTVGVVNLQV